MIIKKLNNNSSQEDKNSAARLLLRQMKFLGEKKTLEDVETVIKDSLSSGSNTHIIIAGSGENRYVGVCFFNICTGVQSGGKYIWINEIYVMEKSRGKGVAAAMLGEVEKIARKKKCIYILAQRDVKNSESKALFDSAGFDQDNVIWMSKKI